MGKLIAKNGTKTCLECKIILINNKSIKKEKLKYRSFYLTKSH